MLFIFYLAFLVPVIIVSAFLVLCPRWYLLDLTVSGPIRKRLKRFYEFDFFIRLVIELYLDIFLTALIASYSVIMF